MVDGDIGPPVQTLIFVDVILPLEPAIRNEPGLAQCPV